MGQKNRLVEYLQGALAGKMIENSARVDAYAANLAPWPGEAFIQVHVPPATTTGSREDIIVRIRNYQSTAVSGVVTLLGEDLVRGMTYDFQAPFKIDFGQPEACIVFRWGVPRFPTKIQWSASIDFDGQMGVGLSRCTVATIVTDPAH